MPSAYVKTIREEVFYEYAKLISRTVLGGEINYGFVFFRLKALRTIMRQVVCMLSLAGSYNKAADSETILTRVILTLTLACWASEVETTHRKSMHVT
jgi:hypothetical protein